MTNATAADAAFVQQRQAVLVDAALTVVEGDEHGPAGQRAAQRDGLLDLVQRDGPRDPRQPVQLAGGSPPGRPHRDSRAPRAEPRPAPRTTTARGTAASAGHHRHAHPREGSIARLAPHRFIRRADPRPAAAPQEGTVTRLFTQRQPDVANVDGHTRAHRAHTPRLPPNPSDRAAHDCAPWGGRGGRSPAQRPRPAQNPPARGGFADSWGNHPHGGLCGPTLNGG